MIVQSLVMILRHFFDFEGPELSPWAQTIKSEARFCSQEHGEQLGPLA